MNTDDEKIHQLAHVFELSADVFERHICRPLTSPMPAPPPGWVVPDLFGRILGIADGFWLFGKDSWNGLKIWGSQEYLDCSDHVRQQAVNEELFPFFGEVPHLTSIRLVDGSVVSSDWEDYKRPEHGWGAVIAPTLQEFIRTLVHIRERYGFNDSCAADWWFPYASHGSRHDLDS